MNKNIIILSIVLIALIATLGIMLMFGQNPVSSPTPILKGVTVAAIDKNIAEINSLDADLALFAGDDVVSQELDITLNEVGEINEASVSLKNDEENLNTLGSDLSDLSNDATINQEIDKALQDVTL